MPRSVAQKMLHSSQQMELFGLLAWLLCFAALGTWAVWRPGIAPKVLAVVLVLVGLAPSIAVLLNLVPGR